ncbi:hypothetical protein GE09DRAFT_1234769 [Coniochaeta sp. 2T2.1]|nr:hypothetical protein GE09DRAFT_1234769 [Coniochaeta sp. 2T2.1]
MGPKESGPATLWRNGIREPYTGDDGWRRRFLAENYTEGPPLARLPTSIAPSKYKSDTHDFTFLEEAFRYRKADSDKWTAYVHTTRHCQPQPPATTDSLRPRTFTTPARDNRPVNNAQSSSAASNRVMTTNPTPTPAGSSPILSTDPPVSRKLHRLRNPPASTSTEAEIDNPVTLQELRRGFRRLNTALKDSQWNRRELYKAQKALSQTQKDFEARSTQLDSPSCWDKQRGSPCHYSKWFDTDSLWHHRECLDTDSLWHYRGWFDTDSLWHHRECFNSPRYHREWFAVPGTATLSPPTSNTGGLEATRRSSASTDLPAPNPFTSGDSFKAGTTTITPPWGGANTAQGTSSLLAPVRRNRFSPSTTAPVVPGLDVSSGTMNPTSRPTLPSNPFAPAGNNSASNVSTESGSTSQNNRRKRDHAVYVGSKSEDSGSEPAGSGGSDTEFNGFDDDE